MGFNAVKVFCFFQHCSSKLIALEVMLKLSKYVTADIILDRLVPCMVSYLFYSLVSLGVILKVAFGPSSICKVPF